jgi:hypothetical protein
VLSRSITLLGTRTAPKKGSELEQELE